MLDALDILHACVDAQEGDNALGAFKTLEQLVLPNFAKKYQIKVTDYFGLWEQIKLTVGLNVSSMFLDLIWLQKRLEVAQRLIYLCHDTCCQRE